MPVFPFPNVTNYSALSSVTKTLSGTSVDWVILTGDFRYVAVTNLSGAANLTVIGIKGQEPALPQTNNDNTKPVPAGTTYLFDLGPYPDGDANLKIIGNGNTYFVDGIG